MRHDMFKVIVERPRAHGSYFSHNQYRKAKDFKLIYDEDGSVDIDDQFCARKLPIRATKHGLGWDRKELNENLNPLRRFLESRVGRPWPDVYSEICSNIDSRSTVKQHVRDHLKWMIHVKTYLGDDGIYYACSEYGVRAISGSGYRGDFFVDEDGILRKSFDQHISRKKHRAKYEKQLRESRRKSHDDPLTYFYKHDGVWLKIRFAWLEERESSDSGWGSRLYFIGPSRDCLGNPLLTSYVNTFEMVYVYKIGIDPAYRGIYAKSYTYASGEEKKKYSLKD